MFYKEPLRLIYCYFNGKQSQTVQIWQYFVRTLFWTQALGVTFHPHREGCQRRDEACLGDTERAEQLERKRQQEAALSVSFIRRGDIWSTQHAEIMVKYKKKKDVSEVFFQLLHRARQLPCTEAQQWNSRDGIPALKGCPLLGIINTVFYQNLIDS